MYISTILIIIAAVSLLITIRFALNGELSNSYARYLTIVGASTFLWCIGQGMLGLMSNEVAAMFWRLVGLAGIDLFIDAEVFFLADQMGISKAKTTVLHITALALSVFSYIYQGFSVPVIFTTWGDRTCFYSIAGPANIPHLLFLGLMLGIGILMGILWFCRAEYKRERRYVKFLFLANIFLILGCVPDTVLPMLGIPSFPGSAFGASITFFTLMYVEKNNSVYRLSGGNLMHYIYDDSQSGIIAFDLDYIVRQANPYARKLIGLSAIEREKSFDQLFELSKESESDIKRRVRDSKEVTTKLRAGRTGTLVGISIRETYDENGDPFMIICYVQDYSEEEEILAKLEIANRSKGEFLSNMSHEIRTPVHAILGLNEMVQRKSTDSGIREYAENIENSGSVLLSIISDILDVSSIEGGAIEIREEPYSLGNLIRDLRILSQERCAKKDLKFQINVDETLPDALIGDATRIRQVITNLLTNAIKYSDCGQVTLEVKRGGEDAGKLQKGDTVLLSVHVLDTGKGIRKEDQKKLFGAFERVDESRNRRVEGTGLGLSISYHYVKAMGGELAFDSEYGKGSDFYFSIPQMVDQALPCVKLGEVKSSESRRYEVAFTAPNARILAVDDNEVNLEVLKLLLTETQIQIDSCNCGMDAIELMKNNHYDLLLLDHMMPQMDGIELFEIIKRDHLSEAPVIVLTANAIEGAKEMYLEKGFTDYISKPIASQKLEEMLYEYLPGNLTGKEGAR